MVAFSAAVSGNYLILTARHLIQTLPTLEKKKKMKHRKNEGRKKEDRVEGQKKRLTGKAKGGRGGVRERENSSPVSAPECLEPQ